MQPKTSRSRVLLVLTAFAMGCAASSPAGDEDPGATAPNRGAGGNGTKPRPVTNPHGSGTGGAGAGGSIRGAAGGTVAGSPAGGTAGGGAGGGADAGLAMPPVDAGLKGGSGGAGVPVGSADAGQRPPQDPTILPVLIVDVVAKSIVKDTKTSGKLRVIESHDGTLNNIAAQPASLETPAGIELRGAWSLQFAKKGFSLELQDATGKDHDQPFLGMPSDSDFALRAGYCDHTLVRDALAYWMFQTLWGRYAPRTRLVELYLGKEYWGVYLLTETIKRNKNRVDLPKVAPDAAIGDLTGSYIVHLESSDNGLGFVTSTKRFWDYRYPSGAEITPPQAAYIKNHMDRFENAMLAPNLADDANGWPHWIDLPSWIDFGLFQELSRNIDGYTKSSYYSKPPDTMNGGRLLKGPIWDFDLGYGNLQLASADKVDGWLYDIKWNVPVPWWERLWKEPRFRNAAVCRWNELRKGKLTSAAINAKVDELAASLAKAQPRENARWKLIGKKETFHSYIGPTYADDVKYLKEWMAKRLTWLDANFGSTCQK